jgi:hypothetical protein
METAGVVQPTFHRPNLEWSAVLGGATIATAVGLILLSFGAALGLGVASPYEGEGLSPTAFAVAAGLYLLWVQVMSFYMGGYVTARMRTRAPELSEHEVDVRDGLHGLVMWGVGVIAAAAIAFVGLGGVGTATATQRGQLTASLSQVAGEHVNAAATQEKVGGSEPARAATLTERQVEIARKLAIISAFITAASLLVGAVAAFFGAHSGGHHRDKNIAWNFFASQARVISQ